ncbi:MAG: phospholipase D-like domain-containing protein [Halobacteria archaeon]
MSRRNHGASRNSTGNNPGDTSFLYVSVLLLSSCVFFMHFSVSPASADSLENTTNVSVVEIYPDSYRSYDEGEYFTVYFGDVDTSGWRVTDGEDSIEIGNITNRRLADREDSIEIGNITNRRLADREDSIEIGNRSGRIYFVSVNLSSGVEANGSVRDIGEIELSNSGDEIRILDRKGNVVTEAEYGSTKEGEILEFHGNDVESRPLGATDLPYSKFGIDNGDNVSGFVVPEDRGREVVDAVRSADDELLIAGYSFDSRYLADEIQKAVERGVDVTLLIEGSPAGGFESDDFEVVDDLHGEGVDVKVVDGPSERYRFLHGKYMVVDGETAVVTSENWEQDSFSSSPGEYVRGWGLVVHDDGFAERLSRVFQVDSNWSSVFEWSEWKRSDGAPGFPEDDRGGDTKQAGGEAEPSEELGSSGSTVGVGNGSLDLGSVDVDSIGLVLAPDGAVKPVSDLIRGADNSVYIQQAYVRGWQGEGSGRDIRNSPYVDAALDVARNGTEVKFLLDDRWFVEEENRRVVEELEGIADRRDLPLEAKVGNVSIHNKGVVVDNQSVLVSSINWNRNSPTMNREVGALVESEAMAGYFSDAFLKDWRHVPGRSSSPLNIVTRYWLELLTASVVAATGVWTALRKIE